MSKIFNFDFLDSKLSAIFDALIKFCFKNSEVALFLRGEIVKYIKQNDRKKIRDYSIIRQMYEGGVPKSKTKVLTNCLEALQQYMGILCLTAMHKNFSVSNRNMYKVDNNKTNQL